MNQHHFVTIGNRGVNLALVAKWKYFDEINTRDTHPMLEVYFQSGGLDFFYGSEADALHEYLNQLSATLVNGEYRQRVTVKE